MSVLILVRHGQASFFSDDYDRLSTVGVAQSCALGDYWARQPEGVDEVYVGPRRRQRETAECVGAQYRASGRSWPEPVVLEALDEYDLAGLLERLGPALAAHDPGFLALRNAYRGDSGEAERLRSFQHMFEALLLHWITTPDEFPQVESWPAFRARVRRGLAQITDRPGHGRHVAAFTSGGFIGTAVGLALAAPDRTALELNWRLRNASVTRLVFTPGRMTLDEFNGMPHLQDRALQTYR